MNSNGGSSETVETEFGFMRLISCRSGVKNLSSLVVGVEIALKSGWILKNVNILPSEENTKADVLPLFQEKKNINEDWTKNYNSSSIFPILLHQIRNQDVPLTVLGEFEACSINTQHCITEKQPLNLLLSAGENYPTLSCGALNQALKTAAVDILKTDVKAENQLLPNGDLKIRLVFPKDIKTLEIQSPNIPIKQTFKKIDNFVFTGIFHPQNPISIGENIPINIRSSNGCFTWNITVNDKELPNIPIPLPFGFGFWSGILLFFLSPLWCIWMMPNKITNDLTLFRKKTRLLQLTAVIGLWGVGFCWITGLNPFGWIRYTIVAGLTLIGLIFLLIKPIFKRVWIMGILIFLFPKPFCGFLGDIHLSTKIYLLLWWTICIYIPFNIWLLAPKQTIKFFEDVQTQRIPAYWIFTRLPYLILIIWLVVSMTGYYYYKTDPIFIPNKTKGSAIVRVTNPVCLTCIKDRIWFLSHLKNLYRIDSDTAWAREKRKLYQISNDTFYIYIKADGQEILLPQNLTRSKLSNILE